ncbi:hypothetical protein [Natronorarus salvus]|uniref:hypothetical protein n=1 Tax=Natronorarus salvus TaxID=3117733 RepID=UPI002F25F874
MGSVQFHTLRCVPPEDEPSSNEGAERIDLVEDEGIEYVYRAITSGGATLARTTVDAADGARKVLTLSTVESLPEGWDVDGLRGTSAPISTACRSSTLSGTGTQTLESNAGLLIGIIVVN